MISFITGKPGDGKTLFAVRQLLNDLVTSEVFVVTNIPLVISKVNEYVTARRTDRQPPFVLDERLKVIPDAEVYEFYRHRSGGLVLAWSPDKEAGDDGAKRIPRPEFVARMKAEFSRIRENKEWQRPVNYYIDEAHNFFSSREWATNGRGLLYYASQHRHLWDNIFLITQVMENVEKQLRSLVSETHAVRNQLRRRIGPVRMRPVFRVSGYYGVPAGNIKPFAVTTFDLDPAKVAGCYKTVGALGVHDTPEQNKNKAPLPWWCLPVGGTILVLVVGITLASLPFLGGKAGAAIVGGVIEGTQAETSAMDPRPAAPPARSGVMPSAAPAAGTSGVPAAPRPGEAPHPTRYLMRGARVTVQMSDGTTRTEADPGLTAVRRNSVTLDGDTLYFRPAPRSEKQVLSEAAPVIHAVPTAGGGVDQAKASASSAPAWDASTGPVGLPSGRIGR